MPAKTSKFGLFIYFAWLTIIFSLVLSSSCKILYVKLEIVKFGLKNDITIFKELSKEFTIDFIVSEIDTDPGVIIK